MTDQQQPSRTDDSAPAGAIHLRKGRHELVASSQAIVIDGQKFPLESVERVFYRAATRINQASYVVGLAQGDRKLTFAFDAYRKGTQMEDARATWSRLVDLLETAVCPRVAREAVRDIAAGATVTFGGPSSSRIDVDGEGLRLRRLFAGKVLWAQVATADLGAGRARVWTKGADGLPQRAPAMSIDMTGWNSVVLPRVVAHLAGH